MEYPKCLYMRGWDDPDDNAIARDAAHEKELRAKGFKDMAEFSEVKEEEPKKRGRPRKGE